MSMITPRALALLLPLVLAAPAWADQGPAGRMGFSQMDQDGDGLITRDELIAAGHARHGAMIDRMLEQADADGDGALSLSEVEAMQTDRRAARMGRMFDRLDTDGDGQISAQEFEAAREGKGRGRGGRDGHRHGFWRG